MKKFILAAAVASMLAAPALAAPDHGRNSRGQIEQRGDHRAGPQRQVQQRQVQQHRWNKGERFNQRQASNYRVISNPRQYRLRDAPRGYRYVQSGNDAVLIAITSGIVASVFANMIR